MQRRLAAILAADMVGYSRLMAADEAAVLARQKRLRSELIDPKIREYQGRIVKTTGDGLLAEFPSVVDALRCAVGIQLSMLARETAAPADQRIAYRIGINLGDVIIEDDDIYGDGVNIAARLEAMADPDGICVSQTVVDHVKTKVASRFEDLGDQAFKNMPVPVRVQRVQMRPEKPGSNQSQGKARIPSKRLAIAAIALITTAIALTVVVLLRWPDGVALDAVSSPDLKDRNDPGLGLASETPPVANPEKASIAVLPFQNLSQEPDQEYFNDGITEDIITVLSKLPDLMVISRNSTFRFKGQEVDPKKVGQELGALYLLTGSVRRSGGDVRISVQLVDAQSGGYVWADRYDGQLADVFALQEAVAQRVANALALSLSPDAASAARRGETENSEAYDLFLRGWEHYRKRTPEHLVRALDYFKKAIAIDPSYARAHAAAASIYWTSVRTQWVGTVIPDEPDEYKRRDMAYKHLAQAMEDPPTLAFQVRSRVNLYRGRYAESLTDAEKAVQLDHNDADALTTLAEALILAGRPQEAFEPIGTAQGLDPYNRSYHSYLQGIAYFGLGQFREAASYLERALELGPEEWSSEIGWRVFMPLYSPLAASYAYLDRTEEAENVVSEIKKVWNSANVATETYYWLYKEDSDRQRLADGLRLAGLPDF